MIFIQQWIERYSRRRFAWLFFSLLLTLVAAPVLSAMGISTRFMEVIVGLNILAAVLLTAFDIRAPFLIGLLALICLSRLAYGLLDYEPLLMASRGTAAITCLLSILVMLRQVLTEGRVTSERIFAGLNVYLMMGIVCGLLFTVFEEKWPGSFSVHGSTLAAGGRIQMAHMLYFSFVTLGTLGYGDVLPVSGPARALAVTEAIGGQIYLVVVVARLVSLYQGPRKPGEDGPAG